MAQAAPVVDLDTFRRSRRDPARPSGRPTMAPTCAANACFVPVWVTWVPMWLVH
jgi:hypothetical protein